MIEERLSSKEMQGLEADFEKIANIDKLISRCEFEIEFPYREFRDENVGGGRSSISVDNAQRVAEAKEESAYLQRLYRLQRIKKELLPELTDQQMQIYKLRWCSNDYYDWLTIGELVKPVVKKTQIYKKREKLLELLAKKEGILRE
ncbi:transcriptional regulator [Liquorilactobacillus nagelii]|uniref:transcriptional regulator n=1 Tax=Liquorilactobacillus nagelii TaxID=82688 RepID=UPI0039E798A9